MNSLSVIIAPIFCLLLVTGCAVSSGQHLETGCPPGEVRVQDDHTGEYDCANQKDYEELMESIDEHARRDRG